MSSSKPSSLVKSDLNHLTKESEFKGANFSFWFSLPPLEIPLKMLAESDQERRANDAMFTSPKLCLEELEARKPLPFFLADPLDASGGCDFSQFLLRQDYTTSSADAPQLDPEDEDIERSFHAKLLSDAGDSASKAKTSWAERTDHHNWLRAFRYLDASSGVPARAPVPADSGESADDVEQILRPLDPVEMHERIMASFVTVEERERCAFVHPTNPALKCVEVIPLLPIEACGARFPSEVAQCQFDIELEELGEKKRLVEMHDDLGKTFAAYIGRAGEGRPIEGGVLSAPYELKTLFTVNNIAQPLTLPIMEYQGAFYYFRPVNKKRQFKRAKVDSDAPRNYDVIYN